MINLKEIVNYIRKNTSVQPKVGIILGSNLGDVAQSFDIVDTIPYYVMDDFPISRTSGHKGRFLFGYSSNVPVMIMQGRIHYYEGYTMEEVTLPIMVMKELGVKTLIITNSAEAIDEKLEVGDIVTITDHVMNVPNPLRKIQRDLFGAKMAQLNPIYDRSLIECLQEVKERIYDVTLKKGIYYQYEGPSSLTEAEVNFIKNFKVSMCGKSTACEAVIARYFDMKVLALSCITAYAPGIYDYLLTYDEIIKNYKNSRENIVALVKGVIEKAVQKELI